MKYLHQWKIYTILDLFCKNWFLSKAFNARWKVLYQHTMYVYRYLLMIRKFSSDELYISYLILMHDNIYNKVTSGM
jgi:hypothetical protein